MSIGGSTADLILERSVDGEDNDLYDHQILRNGIEQKFTTVNLDRLEEGQLGGNGVQDSSKRLTYSWNNINVHASVSVSNWTKLKNLGKKVPAETKHILKDVSGVAYPGELMAIMGSSGAGKTTLLNCLTYRAEGALAVSGERAINGVTVGLRRLTTHASYVQQDDLFIGTLTVKEHLTFQALLRMDKGTPRAARLKRVVDVMNELSLTKCKDTIIGKPGRLKGISGGEMRRLSFASEIITNPSILLCDEPTSGLDSFMAHNIASVLKSMAMKGKTIICTIHQPSSEVYSIFDRVLFLAEGRVAFLGTSPQANEFFASINFPCPINYNPADFIIQTLAIIPTIEEECKSKVKMICDSYQETDLYQGIVKEAQNCRKEKSQDSIKQPRYKASWWLQFRVLLWRSWLGLIKEPMLTRVRVIQTMFVSLVIGIIYFGQKMNQGGVFNINGALFILLTNMTFQNVFAVLDVFCGEIPLFLRENQNGMYRTDVYFITRLISETPIFIVIPILFTSIIYYMVGLNPGVDRFFIAVLITILISNVATSFGYLISSVSPTVQIALSVGPPIIIPFMLFGGLFMSNASVPIYLKWLSDISWFKYGFAALTINQWDGIEHIDCQGSTHCLSDGQAVLDHYFVDKGDYLWDFFALVILMVGFRLLGFLGLLNRAYKHY